MRATLLALTLGGLVGFLVSRPGGGRGTRVLDGVFMLPLGVSAVTVGFGFLVTLDRPPLDLRSSSLLVPVAQAMVALPLVVRTVAPVLRLDPRTTDQSGLDEAGRRANLAGRVQISGVPAGQVVLVDDVVTTGATLQASAAILLSHGADVAACVALCAA